MISTLYDKFKEWSEGGSVYLYSDTHFDDVDCKIMSKDWPTSEEQVKQINKIVHKPDTLIILGDVGNVEWVRKLKAGRKILITGNHDAGASSYKRVVNTVTYDKDEFPKEWTGRDYINNLHTKEKEMGYSFYYTENWSFHRPFDRLNIHVDNRLFDELYEGPLFISEKILLSHEPINFPFALNIHGHVHDSKGGLYDKNHYCVCSNTINYTPINLKTIIDSGILNKIDDIHRNTINKATIRSRKNDKK